MGRPPSKGRQRIEIAPIPDKAAREVTFSKRKSGLLKKASELALLCGAHVAVILFSKAGKVFAFGSPSVDTVLRYVAGLLLPPGGEEYPPDDHDADLAAVEATLRQAEETRALVEAEKARLAAVREKVLQAVPPGKTSWWEADVDQLGKAELTEHTKALRKLREYVQRHADKLRADAPPTPPPLHLHLQ